MSKVSAIPFWLLAMAPISCGLPAGTRLPARQSAGPGVGVGSGVGCGVGLAVGDGEGLGVGVAVGGLVGLGLAVGEADGDRLTVDEGLAEAEADGGGLRVGTATQVVSSTATTARASSPARFSCGTPSGRSWAPVTRSR
jgi:hypothetical protein